MTSLTTSITSFIALRLNNKKPNSPSLRFVAKLVADGSTSMGTALILVRSMTRLTGHKEITLVVFALRDRLLCLENLHFGNQESANIAGTGKNRTKSCNLSTVSSFLLSACGCVVMKHGGTRISSSCGATDIIRKFCLAPLGHWAKAAVLAIEVRLAWFSSGPFLGFLKVTNPIRRKVTRSFLFNLAITTLNPSNATSCFIGSSNCSATKLMLLSSSFLCPNGLFGVSNSEETDKASISTPTLLTELRVNRFSRNHFSLERTGGRIVKAEGPKKQSSQLFLFTFLGVANNLGGLPTLLAISHTTILPYARNIESSTLGDPNIALTNFAAGNPYKKVCHFVRFNSC